MELSRPASPFERVELHGDSFALDTSGKVLVLPTGDAAVLPSFNEYVLNSNRLTIAESPFGGLKGSGSPDYAPGTLFVNTGDGVYLTDTSGTNSTKTLTAGKLKELSLLTVDAVAHSITEEFIVANTGTSNNPSVIHNCDSATGWSFGAGGGTGTITAENGMIKVDGLPDASGIIFIQKTITAIDLSAFQFASVSIESNVTGKAYFSLGSNEANRVYIGLSKTTNALPSNVNSRYIMAIKAPVSNSGSNPSNINGTPNWADVTYMRVGVYVTAGTPIIFYIDNITADTYKSAYIELLEPNHLSATSTIVQCYSGSTYSECRRDSLDGTYANVSSTPANMKMLDGTKFDDVYGANLGRAYFPKGISGETKAGSSGNITYSVNKGTRNRIGFRVDLPPSDGGRTNFSKIGLKIISYYAALSGNYSASYDFADSTNASYGLQNLSKPWIAVYSPTDSVIDFYLFTHRPKNLSFKRNESGVIHELTLYPGNGPVYHGQINYAGLTTDTDSNLIPDCLEASVEGSVTKFLQTYGMVI